MQIPKTRDDIRLHKHTSIYDGGLLDARALSHVSVTSLSGGADIAYLSADQTFTGTNTFDGDVIFNGSVSIDSLSVTSSLVVPDSAFRVTGSADSTKLLAFEVDGFTAATTRTLTVQDADYILAGLNIDEQRFTREQVFYPSVADPWGITVREGPGGGGVARFLDSAGASVVQIDPNLITFTHEAVFNDQIEVNGASTFNADMTVASGADGIFAAGDILLRGDGTSDFANLMTTQGITANGTLTVTSTSVFQVAPKIDIASAATGSVWTATDNDGNGVWSTSESVIDVARTWDTLQTFKDTTWKVVDDGDATKTAVLSLGGATTGADLTLIWSGTADRSVTIPDATTTLAGLAVGQTWTAAQIFDPPGTAVPVTVYADAAGSDAIQLYDSSSNIMFQVTYDGLTIATKADSMPLNLSNGSTEDLTLSILGVGAGATCTLRAGNMMTNNSTDSSIINKTFGTGTSNWFRTNTAASGVGFQDNTVTTKQFRLVLSGLATSTNNSFTLKGAAVRDWEFTDPGSNTVVNQRIFSQDATVTHANSTTETTLVGAGIGSATLPASFFVTGRSLRFEATGVYSSAAAAGTLRIQLKKGTTTLLDTGAQTLANSMSNRVWRMQGVITGRSTTTVIGQSFFEHMATSGVAGITFWEMNNGTTAVTIGTTSEAIDITADWGTADAANTISMTNFTLTIDG